MSASKSNADLAHLRMICVIIYVLMYNNYHLALYYLALIIIYNIMY